MKKMYEYALRIGGHGGHQITVTAESLLAAVKLATGDDSITSVYATSDHGSTYDCYRNEGGEQHHEYVVYVARKVLVV